MFRILKKRIIDWCLKPMEIDIKDFHKLTQSEEYNDGKFVEVSSKRDYLIETPTGFERLNCSLKTIPMQVYHLVFEDGTEISCADNHLFENQFGNFVWTTDLIEFKLMQVKSKNGLTRLKSWTTDETDLQPMYDLSVDSKEKTYFVGDVVCHNTTIVTAFILWYTLFTEIPQKWLCVSRNLELAMDILSRIKFAFEKLPKWMQKGTTKYNDKSIVFEDGSYIYSRSTTKNSGRGLSPTCVTG